MRGLDHCGTRYVLLDDLLLLVERYRQAWDGHGDGDAASVLAALADALAEWSITMPENAQVAAPDDHETPRGRDGADTGCTEVPDEQREGPSAASITNVLGHRDAAGSHLVALQERDAALAELADARLALAVHTGRRSFVLDPDERAAVGRALAALDEEEVDGA